MMAASFQVQPSGVESVGLTGQPPVKSPVWHGDFIPIVYTRPVYSCKIFVGGIAKEVEEQQLITAFQEYGSFRMEFPTKDMKRSTKSSSRSHHRIKAPGYLYIVFDSENSVKKLLAKCSNPLGPGNDWFLSVRLQSQSTEVQVIPWLTIDAEYMTGRAEPDQKLTAFVGGLHGKITARMLCSIMSDIYGEVVFVSIHTDKYKYPIGSGRVTFATRASYMRAIRSRFLDIVTPKFSKRIQIDPFLEDARCALCACAQGSFFCRERECFNYYCGECWDIRHARSGPFGNHEPLQREMHRAFPREPSSDDRLLKRMNRSQTITPLLSLPPTTTWVPPYTPHCMPPPPYSCSWNPTQYRRDIGLDRSFARGCVVNDNVYGGSNSQMQTHNSQMQTQRVVVPRWTYGQNEGVPAHYAPATASTSAHSMFSPSFASGTFY